MQTVSDSRWVRAPRVTRRDVRSEPRGPRQFNPHPKTATLDRHATTLREAFSAQPPHTVQEAGDRIAALTGVRRGPTPVRA